MRPPRCLATAIVSAACTLAALARTQLVEPAPTASATDSLRLQYAAGIVAVAEDKIITVGDVARRVQPLVAGLQSTATGEKDFQEKLGALQDDTIQDLIDRVLIIKEFKKDERRHIPESYIDSAVDDELAERFEGDRAKFLAYLRAQGMTKRDYRHEKEEDIIYSYMRGQQRRSQSVISPARIETYYAENKDRFYREDEVHLRIIHLARAEDTASDEALLRKANMILARFKAGEKFADLAKEFSASGRTSGGDWNWIPRSNLRPEFADPAFRLAKGEVGTPILTADACYLIFAEDRHYAGIQPLDEVRDAIERMLVTQMTRSSQERWLERLRRNGYVKHY